MAFIYNNKDVTKDVYQAYEAAVQRDMRELGAADPRDIECLDPDERSEIGKDPAEYEN